MRYIIYFFTLLLVACSSTEVKNTFPANKPIEPMVFLPDTGDDDLRPSVKILYIHGMSASEYCGSYKPVKAILEEKWGSVSGTCDPSKNIDFNLPKPSFTYGSQKIDFNGLTNDEPVNRYWSDSEKSVGWAEPSLNKYIFRSNSQTAEIYEVNYWPLLVYIKCKTIVESEVVLSGSDFNVETCKEVLNIDIDRDNNSQSPPVNKAIKKILLEWGFSDAVLTLGDVGDVNRSAVLEAIKMAKGEDEDGVPFHIVTASLGSYVLVDALIGSFLEYSEDSMREISTDINTNRSLERGFGIQMISPDDLRIRSQEYQSAYHELVTLDNLLSGTSVYMYANQIALLSLADIKDSGRAAEDTDKRDAIIESILESINFDKFVAFNEHGDLLSYQTPNPFLQLSNINGHSRKGLESIVDSYNVNLGFANSLLGLVSNPYTAHTAYYKSDVVNDVIVNGYYPEVDD